MRFSSLLEQNKIINSLIAIAKEGRISHAQLFYGSESSKAFALSIAYAQYLNCDNKIQLPDDSSIIEDSCGECLSCKKFQTLSHPDLHFIFPNTNTKKVLSKSTSKQFLGEFKSYVLKNNADIDLNSWYEFIEVGNKQGMINVRDANDIVSDLNVKAYESKYKVTIIWSIDKLNYEAAPKLLKILEEPFDNTLFLLITHNRENILPTIISRTQLVKIPNLKKKDFHNQFYLIEVFVEWMRSCFQINSKIDEVVGVIDKIYSLGREDQKQLLKLSLDIFQKSFLINQNIAQETPLENIEEKFRDNFPNFVSKNNIEKIYKELDKAILHIERNGNPKLIFLDSSINVGFLLKNK